MCVWLIKMSGKRGSNPRPSAWEADALPLSYSRLLFFFEAPLSLGPRVPGTTTELLPHKFYDSNVYNIQIRCSTYGIKMTI